MSLKESCFGMCTTEGSASARVLIENEKVKITEWTFKTPGENTGWHKHLYDYIVVPLFDGNLEISDASSNSQIAELSNGIPYFRFAGVEHDVKSINEFECAFLEIELIS